MIIYLRDKGGSRALEPPFPFCFTKPVLILMSFAVILRIKTTWEKITNWRHDLPPSVSPKTNSPLADVALMHLRLRHLVDIHLHSTPDLLCKFNFGALWFFRGSKCNSRILTKRSGWQSFHSGPDGNGSLQGIVPFGWRTCSVGKKYSRCG